MAARAYRPKDGSQELTLVGPGDQVHIVRLGSKGRVEPTIRELKQPLPGLLSGSDKLNSQPS